MNGERVLVGSARAHPNLALIKYWGKSDYQRFLPASPSIGISLKEFVSETRVRCYLNAERGDPLELYAGGADVGTSGALYENGADVGTSGALYENGAELGESGAEIADSEFVCAISTPFGSCSWLLTINGNAQESAHCAVFFEAVLRLLRSKRRVRVAELGWAGERTRASERVRVAEPGWADARKQACEARNIHFYIESTNNFPTASGLASSASGFAALAGAISAALGLELGLAELSELARWGSISASRSVFGGFVALPSRAERAESLYNYAYWENLCCIIVIISAEKKSVSSRNAMRQCEETSPFYSVWLNTANSLYASALTSIKNKNIHSLGACMQKSYMRMFSTMFTCDDPIIYWKPESLSVINLLRTLRKRGIPAYETMDAGPQIKILSIAKYANDITSEVQALLPHAMCVRSEIGGDIRIC